MQIFSLLSRMSVLLRDLFYCAEFLPRYQRDMADVRFFRRSAISYVTIISSTRVMTGPHLLRDDQKAQWTGEIVTDRERQTIWLPKLMVTVVWKSSRSHVLKSPATGRKFNTQYYPHNILGAILHWRRLAGGTWPNKL
jgi:hypothetical protein